MSNNEYRIIIVDDVKALCNSLRRELTQIGTVNKVSFKITDYQDPVQALKDIKLSLPDLVISDIKMPYMTGDVMIAKLKKELPEMPVLVISAFATRESILSIIKTDKNIIILSKPWDQNKLISSVGQLLNLYLKPVVKKRKFN